MTTASMLEEALQIAVEAHRGQVNKFKSDEPYIFHPLHVMFQFQSPEYQIVAVLHDVLEDCPNYYLSDFTTRFPQVIVEALDAITRRDKETYMDYIGRVKENKIARRVKIADINHNIDRLPSDQEELRERYDKALSKLM